MHVRNIRQSCHIGTALTLLPAATRRPQKCFALRAVWLKEECHSKQIASLLRELWLIIFDRCNMDCGPNGSSMDGSCKCAKGYSECPLGFRGDTCQEPISACSFVNNTAPVTVCEGNQAVTCVYHTAVNATTCAEGCRNGKCICNRENNCSGHGTCLGGVCQCDIGWAGYNCQDKQVREP